MTEDDRILLAFCLLKLDQMTETVLGLGEGTMHEVLPVEGSNSPAAILVHCCGMMRHWSSTVNLGVPVPRDREAEFRATPSREELRDLVATTRRHLEADVRRTDLSSAPRAVPAGRGELWTRTCRGVLLHVLEELSQHLGQVEVTRDVLRAR